MMYRYLDKIKHPSDIKKLDDDALKILSDEIRHCIIDTVSKNGGHLASNLGVVELTLALHLAFDSPKDQFVFDVSHQSYVHKLLTGRFEIFKTLRQYNGMSGFAKRGESEHDIFEAGHASTSLSAALGLAKARDIKKEDFSVVSIIGDGALSGGLAYEGLNNIGHDKTKLIIVINDNEMSISKNVGSLPQYLTRIRTNPNYYKAKEGVHHYIEKIPGIGKPIAQSISKIKASIKQILVPGMLFEELGLTYIGVIDGHDINTLKDTFLRAKNVDGPVVIHIKTLKGKGYHFAEDDPESYHGVGAFDHNVGIVKKIPSQKTFSKVFSEAICKIANDDSRICAITAAMPSGTGLDDFQKRYPERYFDVGIAESHAVTFAAGLAINGLKPFFTVYSTFLQRGYDQIIHDVCIQNAAVTFCIDRAGLVGNDGETHHGVFDLSYLLSIPNMDVMVPKDGTDLRTMLGIASHYKTPLAIRYPRGSAYSDLDDYVETIDPEVISKGNDFYILAIGRMHHIAYDALRLLEQKKLKGSLITPKLIKPLDLDFIDKVIDYTKPIITIEDNNRQGGFGEYFRQQIGDRGHFANVYTLGIDDKFVTHGDVNLLFKTLELDPEGICKTIEKILNHE